MLNQLRLTTSYEQNYMTIKELMFLLQKEPRFNYKKDIVQSFKNENKILKL